MVQVRVQYAGINFADIMMRMGLYPDAPKTPFVPGYEIAGEVAEVGDGVSGFEEGDRVMAVTRFGGYTSRKDVAAEELIKLPKALPTKEAAALPVNYLTAWIALHRMARVTKGDRVLIHGGAGGVGLAAVAMAQLAGCDVHATAGGPQKCAFLEERGVAAHDHTSLDWRERAKEATGGGFDRVLDPIGGAHTKQSLRMLAPGGLVVGYGASELAPGLRRNPVKAVRGLAQMRLGTPGLMNHNTGFVGLNLLHLWKDDPDGVRADFETIAKLVVRGKLPLPHIAATFDLERAGDAHRFIQDRRNIGKVLLRT